MRRIRDDLWETSTDSPFPGLTTHAYLWTGGPDGNVLFYSPATDADFDGLDHLRGVHHQYLSHRDEAGPMLARIQQRFGATLHAPAPELADIGKRAPVGVPLSNRHVDDNGIEVIPTPGHTPGSTSYLVTAGDGTRLLFTGDTLFEGDDGNWAAGYLPPMSDAATLAESLQVLRTLTPDVVISSAFPSDSAVHVLGTQRWSDHVDGALQRLRAEV
ncbi:MBL fold metallo-hydrolase [Mycolicibacterium mengxianglii]|uniref:MBL fold metallo-hydrolase n=1 Tax=Mycolicibacterium mengxianglii TaxID=2736649 RepID=UPI0018D140E6|nr:MBL fold metallo-hydrolase [Mycolicibacterium mengxianglii]